jgi:hypothetical protein
MNTRAKSGWQVLSCLLLAVAFGPQAWAQPKATDEAGLKAAGARQLTGPEIRQQTLGNTSYMIFLADTGPVKAGAVVVTYARNERNRVDLLPTKEKQEKNWWIEGNNYCSENKVVNVGHACYSMWDLGGTNFACLQPSKKCFLSYRTVPGNPEGL